MSCSIILIHFNIPLQTWAEKFGEQIKLLSLSKKLSSGIQRISPNTALDGEFSHFFTLIDCQSKRLYFAGRVLWQPKRSPEETF